MEVTLEEREPEPEPAPDDESLTLVQQISKKIRLEKKKQQQVSILGCLELWYPNSYLTLFLLTKPLC